MAAALTASVPSTCTTTFSMSSATGLAAGLGRSRLSPSLNTSVRSGAGRQAAFTPVRCFQGARDSGDSDSDTNELKDGEFDSESHAAFRSPAFRGRGGRAEADSAAWRGRRNAADPRRDENRGNVFNFNDGNAKLLRALAVQGWRSVAPLAQELIEPWLQLPPPALTDTVRPELLGDVDSRWVDVLGSRVHYKETGRGADPDKPALILLHGFSARGWDWPTDSLTPSPLTQEGAAQLTIALLGALKVKRAVLLGHSAGAQVAVDAAAIAPSRISGLILVAPAVAIDEGSFKLPPAPLTTQLRRLYQRALLSLPGIGLNAVRGQLRRRRSALESGGHEEFGYNSTTGAVEAEVVEGYTRPMRAHDWDRGSLALFQQFLTRPPQPPDFDSITAPALVLQGEQDRAVPVAWAKKLSGALKSSVVYKELPSCGHCPAEEQTEETVKAIDEFLAAL
eukprot:jgi/Chlat1/7800/Chrsp66S09168